MKLRDLYTEYFLNWITSGSFILRDKLSALGIKPAFDRILTKKYVTKVWQITSLPVYYDENLTELIRVEMTISNPMVKTLVYIRNIPTNPNVNSDVYRRQMANAVDRYHDYERVFNSLNDVEQATGKTFRDGARRFVMRKSDLVRLKERADSFKYVYDRANGEGDFYKSYIFVHAYAENNKDLINYKRDLQKLLGQRKIYYREIQGNVSKYLSNFGPAAYTNLGKDSGKFPTLLMSDENLATTVPYRTMGLVGKKGALLGIDKNSKFPFMLDLFSSPAGQVILWIAKTGKGKTLSAQNAALQMTGMGHHVSATDIKGGEWERLSPMVKTLVISMDDTSGRFVNVLRLDDLPVTRETAQDVFKTAVFGCVQLFSLIINLLPTEGNATDLENILEKAILKAYNKRQVFASNPYTFKNTKDMFYSEAFEALYEFQHSTAYTEEKKKLCVLAADRLSTFFHSNGQVSANLRNEVTLSEVIDTPLVVYSFNKNRDTMLSLMDNVRVFMSQFLSLKKQYYRKMQGLHTVDYYEELQRADQFAHLLKVISHAVTGSRSNNVVVNLLLNTLSIFDNPDTKAIASNISTVICGHVNPSDMEALEKLGFEDMIPDVERISNDKDNRYRNCFAIKYDNGVEVNNTIFKTMLPDYIEEMLRSRDVVS